MSTPPKKVFVASDHAGYKLKLEVIDVASQLGFEVEDLGAHSEASVDYPDYAHAVAERVAKGQGFGVLVCGTGIGMSIAANRHKGVRAACVSEPFSAKMTRLHNDANVLCFGSRVVGPGVAAELVRAFLETEFEGGRHASRVAKIDR